MVAMDRIDINGSERIDLASILKTKESGLAHLLRKGEYIEEVGGFGTNFPVDRLRFRKYTLLYTSEGIVEVGLRIAPGRYSSGYEPFVIARHEY